MDYVVAGFGIGAILALAGFALWELYGNVEEAAAGWLSRAAIGLMLGSLVIWSVTGVTLLSTIDDSTGSRLVFFTSLVTLVAVAAGSFWYWRADQAIGASVRRQPRPHAERPAAVAPLLDDAELSEWDSWPERGERRSDEPAVAAAAAAVAAASFEPEVAVEAVEVVEEPAEEAVETTDEATAEPDEQPDTESDAEPVGAAETEIAAVADEVDESEAEPEVDEPPAGPLPANVRSFRVPASTSEALPTDEADDSEPTVAAIDDAAPAKQEPEEEAGEAGPHPDRSSSDRNGTPTGFESSLLADIDASTAEADGRYRSPLLSDLVPDPDELEGVGLAKWRPNARLDAEDDEPPRKTRKK